MFLFHQINLTLIFCELKVKLTPTLMCTSTVGHVFGNQECVAVNKQAGWTLEKKASGS